MNHRLKIKKCEHIAEEGNRLGLRVSIRLLAPLGVELCDPHRFVVFVDEIPNISNEHRRVAALVPMQGGEVDCIADLGHELWQPCCDRITRHRWGSDERTAKPLRLRDQQRPCSKRLLHSHVRLNIQVGLVEAEHMSRACWRRSALWGRHVGETEGTPKHGSEGKVNNERRWANTPVIVPRHIKKLVLGVVEELRMRSTSSSAESTLCGQSRSVSKRHS